MQLDTLFTETPELGERCQDFTADRADAALLVGLVDRELARPMVVDERRQQVLEEVVDQRRVVARDVAVAEVVAHHRGVFALHQRVVVAVSWAGFGELLDVQIVQQFGDLSIDVLRAIVRVEAIDYKLEMLRSGRARSAP